MFLYYIFNTMLIMLLIFHIYWWKLICAMIYRQLKNRGKVGEDIRSGKQVSSIQIESIISILLFFCPGTCPMLGYVPLNFFILSCTESYFSILFPGAQFKMLLLSRMFCNSCIFRDANGLKPRIYWFGFQKKV